MSKKVQILKNKLIRIEQIGPALLAANSLEPLHKITRLSLSEISEFENKYSVELPLLYKLILNEIGNGAFGLSPLDLNPQNPYKIEEYNNLKENFLYKRKFLIEDLGEFSKQYKKSTRFVKNILDLERFRKSYQDLYGTELGKQLKLFVSEGFFEGDIFIEKLHYEYSYSRGHVKGCLQLEDWDDGIGYFLVVTGPQRNEVWKDDLFESKSILPLKTKKWKNYMFFDWLNDRLNTILRNR